MPGILVMHFLLGVAGAIRIDKGFMDKKNPKKSYILKNAVENIGISIDFHWFLNKLIMC